MTGKYIKGGLNIFIPLTKRIIVSINNAFYHGVDFKIFINLPYDRLWIRSEFWCSVSSNTDLEDDGGKHAIALINVQFSDTLVIVELISYWV